MISPETLQHYEELAEQPPLSEDSVPLVERRIAIRGLCAEVRRLQADNAQAVAGYDELVKEREIYRSRWLGCEGEKAALQADNARMREALRWFVDDADGTHTVMTDFDEALKRARAALATSSQPGDMTAQQTQKD